MANLTSEIIYNGQLRNTATHISSKIEIQTDAPKDNQGLGNAFSPTDLVATGLATCILTIMGIKARDRQINIDQTRASVQKIMASNPRRIAEIVVDIFFPQQEYSEKERILLERAAMNCPVHRSLHPDVIKTVNFHYS